MRSEPVVAAARPATPVRPSPALSLPAEPVRPAPALTGVDPHRWVRLAGWSLLVVLVSGALTATGPAGQVLGALVGFPMVAVFWFSLCVWPFAVGWAHWRALRVGTQTSQHQVHVPARATAPVPRPQPSRTVRVTGSEDNWVKGAQGEQAAGGVLDGTGLPVLHDRRLRRGSRANIDHVVVAADAVYVVDAKNINGALDTSGGSLRLDGWRRDKLLDGVRMQADEIAGVLAGLDVAVPVRPVLCLTGAAKPVGMQSVRGVLLTTPQSLASALTLPGPLDDGRRAEIADLVAWVFPPAVSA